MSTEAPSSTHFPFLRLPPEVRLEVYRHLLLRRRGTHLVPTSMQRYSHQCWVDPDPNKNLHPAILRTCRLVRNEATDVLYSENLFGIHHVDLNNANLCLVKQAARICKFDPNGEQPGVKMFCCLHKVLEGSLGLDRVEIRLEDHVFVVNSDILTAPCWPAISFIRSNPEFSSNVKLV